MTGPPFGLWPSSASLCFTVHDFFAGIFSALCADTMTEKMLVAMIIILGLPYLLWRLGRTEHWAPLVVIQILTGIALGPGLLGSVFPNAYQALFTPEVMWMLGGLASWGVILFVWLAGLELDLTAAWSERRDGTITAADTTGLTSVTYEVNSVSATLPLTLAVIDILTINFDAAGADGVIILSGSYA